MRAEQTGIVVARGIGMGFIILGACSGLGAVAFFGPAVSWGWTRYSPAIIRPIMTSIVCVSPAGLAQIWLSCLAELMLGSALILLSKPVGRWLSRSIKDDTAGE
jgi:hypothetical protein